MTQAVTGNAVADLAREAAGTWTIDASHSNVEFIVRHLMSKVRGRFTDFSGDIVVNEQHHLSRVDVVIKAESVSTNDERRDGHLKSGDFFDVEKFATLEFHSTGLEVRDGDTWALHGDLTIHGVSKPVTLDFEYLGSETDPWGQKRVAFSAKTEINREDYGLTWNQALESGSLLVSKSVKIELEIEATRSQAAADASAESETTTS